MCIVLCPKHCHDPLSHFAISASSRTKLMHTRQSHKNRFLTIRHYFNASVGTPQIVLSERENFADIKWRGMRDRSMRSETEMARKIQLTDWSTAGNLSNRSSGVQIPRDICTRFGRYLYSMRCSWIIKSFM